MAETGQIFKSIGPISANPPGALGVFALMTCPSINGRIYLMERPVIDENGRRSFFVHEIASGSHHRSVLITHNRDPRAQVRDPSASPSDGDVDMNRDYCNLDGPATIFKLARLMCVKVPASAIWGMVKDILRGVQHLVEDGASHGLLDRPASIGAMQVGPGRFPIFILNNFNCEREHGQDEDMDRVAKGELRAIIRLLEAFVYDEWLPLDAIEHAIGTLRNIDELEWDGWDGCTPAKKLERAANCIAKVEAKARLAIHSSPEAREQLRKFVDMLDGMAKETMSPHPMTFETLREAQEEARLHGPRWEPALIDPETFQLLFMDDD